MIQEGIVYLQTINDSLQEVPISKVKSEKYQFKIKKVDSLLAYHRPKNYHKRRYQNLLKKYQPNSIFESKLIYLDSSEVFIQSAIIQHKRFSFPKHGNFNGYITKELIQNYRNLYAEGGGSLKRYIQIFPVNEKGKIDFKPLYSFNAFADKIEVYDREGYFVSVQFGCCMSTDIYEVFDLKGKYILSSNHSIKVIQTTNKIYFIGVLKDEIPDMPVIFIQDFKGNTQYLSFSNINLDNIVEDHFYLKFKHENKIAIRDLYSFLDKYELDNLNNLELWLPFNQKDTLKIPFENEKAFGIDYPQIELQLVIEE